MIAFAWRQFRAQALVGVLAFVIVGVALAITGPHLVSVYDAGVTACRESGGQSAACSTNPVTITYSALRYGVIALILVVPALIGMFWGAPLIAHELETGTFRLAWTQSVSRMRWLLVKLGLVGLASFLVAGLLSLMANWWYSPLDKASPDRFGAGNFAVHGFVPGGYALFAFTLGVTAGLILRRTLPAMAVTLAGFIAARLVVTDWVRAHYMSPATLTQKLSPSNTGFELNGPIGSHATASVIAQAPGLPNAWVYGANIVDDAGQSPTTAVMQHACPNLGSSPPPDFLKKGGGLLGSHSSAARATGGIQDAFNHCLNTLSANYHAVATYQPANRFWAFQAIETALFVVLALALAGVCAWWVRHRIT
ncbi:MAG TPA: ABC transporter permease subunit [Acidimicrobiales bacterium]|nr:ABC transporter permease subunit [Acidimicrobiales bacterium]